MPAPTPAKSVEPSLPREVDGFRLLRELGRGGMGIVYQAEELASGRAVALKVLATDELVSEEAFERFRREARMAASISDPHCVFVYGAHQVDGAPAIAMELCPGETLEHRLGKHQPIPIETAVRWTLEILEGLEAAHAAGVVHRDVKPSNCFITSDGHVKVGDFGLSRSLDTDVRLTQSGAFLGSPLYASPEQIKGRDVDLRSDVYSCGATLHALLAGRPPFLGQNIGEVLARILSESPPSLRAARPDVSAELERVVARAMEREPGRRFQDHASFRAALEPFLDGEDQPAARTRRALAFALDQLVLVGTLTQCITILVVSLGWARVDSAHPGSLEPLGFLLLILSVPALYYGLSEGLAGASPAKWLFGQRVQDARTGRPSLSRALLRAFVFCGPRMAWDGFLLMANLGQETLVVLAAIGTPAIYLVLASTMRRRNGFRGLHELASGTRVVQVRSPFTRFQDPRPVPVQTALPAEGWPAEVGPYRIEGAIGATPGGTLLQCVDQNLGRAAWMHARPAGAGESSADRRALVRPGRLRWLGSARQDGVLFETFEAPGGASLSECLARTAGFDWPTAHRLLAGLAAELADVADAPGGAGARACMEQLWIDRAWNLRVLDEPIGSGEFAARAPLELLCEAARSILGTRDAALPEGLPISAEPVVRRLLGRGAPFSSVAEASHELQELAGGPMRLGSPTRALQLVASAVAPALALLASLFFLFVMTDALESIGDGKVSIRELRAQDATPAPDRPMDADDRRAREILVAHGAASAWAHAFASKFDAEEFAVQARAVAAHATPSAEDVAWARARIQARPFPAEPAASSAASADAGVFRAELGPHARIDVGPGDRPLREQRWRMIPAFFALALGLWGVASTLSAWIFRGGLSLKLFGIGVRDRQGELASRLRCVVRSLVLWVPLTALYGAGTWLAFEVTLAAGAALTACTVLLQAYAIAYAIARPERGLQDRLAGTRLVPR